jgi:hypothetical protein
MKKYEWFLTLIFGTVSILSWLFPNIKIEFKVSITGIIIGLIGLLFFKDKLSYFFRKFWLEIITITLLIISSLIIWQAFPDFFLPLIIILLICISITIMVNLKYNQKQVFRSRTLVQAVRINNAWVLNHWGGKCAVIESNKMIFKGKIAPIGNDGSHIDFKDFLEYGTSYAIRCFVISSPDCTAYFQLWCHDNIGASVHGVEIATEFKRPSIKGEFFELVFKPLFNHDLRIHLQYSPGEGSIEVSDVEIYKLK